MHSFESLKDFVFQFPGICKDNLQILLIKCGIQNNLQ